MVQTVPGAGAWGTLRYGDLVGRWRGYTGYYPAAKPSRQPATTGSGPWAGPRVGWKQAGRTLRDPEKYLKYKTFWDLSGARTQPSPAWLAPVGPGGGWVLPGPIWARFDLILLKLSQNARVSPKYVEKAWHSPYFQNGLRISPLDILRFPFLAAFSHKELMVLF